MSRLEAKVNHTKIRYYAELLVYPITVGGVLLYDVDGSGFAGYVSYLFWYTMPCIVGTLLRSRGWAAIDSDIFVSIVTLCRETLE